jgi:hypothetical protein
MNNNNYKYIKYKTKYILYKKYQIGGAIIDRQTYNKIMEELKTELKKFIERVDNSFMIKLNDFYKKILTDISTVEERQRLGFINKLYNYFKEYCEEYYDDSYIIMLCKGLQYFIIMNKIELQQNFNLPKSLVFSNLEASSNVGVSESELSKEELSKLGISHATITPEKLPDGFDLKYPPLIIEVSDFDIRGVVISGESIKTSRNPNPTDYTLYGDVYNYYNMILSFSDTSFRKSIIQLIYNLYTHYTKLTQIMLKLISKEVPNYTKIVKKFDESKSKFLETITWEELDTFNAYTPLLFGIYKKHLQQADAIELIDNNLEQLTEPEETYIEDTFPITIQMSQIRKVEIKEPKFTYRLYYKYKDYNIEWLLSLFLRIQVNQQSDDIYQILQLCFKPREKEDRLKGILDDVALDDNQIHKINTGDSVDLQFKCDFFNVNVKITNTIMVFSVTEYKIENMTKLNFQFLIQFFISSIIHRINV